jgi:hypothetical protein
MCLRPEEVDPQGGPITGNDGGPITGNRSGPMPLAKPVSKWSHVAGK